MRTLIAALTEWLEADTTLKHIEASTAELGDYARGFEEGVEAAECLCVNSETDEG